MHYKLSYEIPTRHFIHIDFSLQNIAEDQLSLCLPFWRPGRYEKGSFAKNIQEFQVYDGNGKRLPFKKVNSHEWLVDTVGVKEVKVSYNFYAADLNAGSTYVDKGFLYVNPVNAFLYKKNEEHEPCTLELNLPEELACHGAMPALKKGSYRFTDFHHLADTPFICSNEVETLSVEVDKHKFYLHFWGYAQVPEKKVLRDFKKFIAFTGAQFPEYPFKDYHFLFFALPNSFHHGVEHRDSTVIALGPGHSIFTDDYQEFLSISSHELYHAWNVKSIRPIEFWPYRYNEESYSRLGYLCEGVTTYMGHLLLLQSGVSGLSEMEAQLSKFANNHFNNFGRYNLSVADSSYDTWLDGYQRGIPNRKVSIYNEGALISFFIDTSIRQKHGGKESLHSVMNKLYIDFYQEGKGVSEADYWNTIAHYMGDESHELYRKYVDGTEDFHQPLQKALDYLGFELLTPPSSDFHEAHLGFRLLRSKVDQRWEILSLYPGSPAETMGLYVGDIILMVNKIPAEDDLYKWLSFFQDEDITLTVKRNELVKEIVVSASDKVFYKDFVIKRLEETSKSQREAFNKWVVKK